MINHYMGQYIMKYLSNHLKKLKLNIQKIFPTYLGSYLDEYYTTTCSVAYPKNIEYKDILDALSPLCKDAPIETLWISESTADLIPRSTHPVPFGIDVVVVKDDILPDSTAFVVSYPTHRFEPLVPKVYEASYTPFFSLYNGVLNMNLYGCPQIGMITNIDPYGYPHLFNPLKKWWTQIREHFRIGWINFKYSLKED